MQSSAIMEVVIAHILERLKLFKRTILRRESLLL